MDKRLILKYEQLPKGEQIGKRPPVVKAEEKSPKPVARHHRRGGAGEKKFLYEVQLRALGA